MGRKRRWASIVLAAATALAVLVPAGTAVGELPGADVVESQEFALDNWEIFEMVAPQPCTDLGYPKTVFARPDCGFGRVFISPPTAGKQVKFTFIDSAGAVVSEQFDTTNAGGRADFRIVPDQHWAPGEIVITATMESAGDTGVGRRTIILNPLEIIASTAAGTYGAGEDITIQGTVNEFDIVTCCVNERTPVPATVTATLHTADGTQIAGPVVVTASGSVPNDPTGAGEFSLTFPGSSTADITADASTGFRANLAARFVARYEDPTPFVGDDGLPKTSGEWAGEASAPVVVVVPPNDLVIENSFVSSTGWVKPGETYPFRVFVKNFTESPATDVVVDFPDIAGSIFTNAIALTGSGSAEIALDGQTMQWTIPTLPAATDAGPSVATLVVEARARTLGEDPEVVWKDISSTAVLQSNGAAAVSHGPKVIPPAGGYESARYGDKPFPMVPVDYRDRKHSGNHSGDVLSRVVNDPDYDGSTFNLYQEMSYGQLFPIGAVPSNGIATAGWDYEHGFEFTTPDPTRGTCRGTTLGLTPQLLGTPAYPERIVDGWYQLPGDTEYYGGDWPAFTLGAAGGIDSACGSISKSVYDAAVIADPEIDYNDFDSDKDGVVDFFMMVFVGIGGNGASQLQGVPPYDNIWPHSSSLEFAYTDEATGLKGYVSDDQLKDLTGTPQCWIDASYNQYDDCAAFGGSGDDNLPTYVRVGPYNVNPEDAIDTASVISHEYGHHLGLPDFYASYSAYNDWNLMASDYSQHMTIFGKQEMGWVVPEFLAPGDTVPVVDWEEIKNDTESITWQRPDGTFYTLSTAAGDQNVHNGQAYGVKLPRKLVIDPQKVEDQASAPYVWYSGRGNNFGCPPDQGHNLDIVLPELESVEPGTPVELSFKSSWDIEWDWDYGFVMVTTDGSSYEALPSENGYTTDNAYNPNNASCFTEFNNGITGQSGTYAAGLAAVTAERANPHYADGSPFLTDSYDLSAYAGQSNVVVRFGYFTDPGFDRPGWFIDDVSVTAGGEVLYESEFTQEEPLRTFPGGCGDEGMMVAAGCTDGWSRIKADAGVPLDHGYYLELRDRSGFDYDGRGQSDRGDIGWSPGVLIEYTDEARGYGNNGGTQPPNQHYIDSQPEPGFDCGDNLVESEPDHGVVLTPPRCQDAAFTATSGDSHFDDLDWIDNFRDDSSADGSWHFDYGCLTLDVTAMSGHTGNSDALPSDLTADAVISASENCVFNDYGHGIENQRPTAIAQARPTIATVDETVDFDGSRSFDDLTPTDNLGYGWDFDGDGTTDATTQFASHAFDTPGTYVVVLTVIDTEGLIDTDSVVIDVRGSGDNVPPTARDDNAAVAAGQSVNIAVKSNDEDLNDGTAALTVTVEDLPAHGEAIVEPDGTVTYTHNGDAAVEDTFTYRVTDPHGAFAIATVTISISDAPEGEPVERVRGSGWWDGDSGAAKDKVNFSFDTKQNSHPGKLKLNDKGAGVTFDADATSDPVTADGVDCGGVTLSGPDTFQFSGTGTFDDGTGPVHATLYVCGQDNGNPGNNGDVLAVRCIDGCNYDSADRVIDAGIDGGNIHVDHTTGQPDSDPDTAPDTASTAPSGTAGDTNGTDSGSDRTTERTATTQSTTGAPVVVVDLDPILVGYGISGTTQVFTVMAHTATGLDLAGRTATLTWTNPDGTVESATAVTDTAGIALFTRTVTRGDTEYIATIDGTESNAINITGLL